MEHSQDNQLDRDTLINLFAGQGIDLQVSIKALMKHPASDYERAARLLSFIGATGIGQKILPYAPIDPVRRILFFTKEPKITQNLFALADMQMDNIYLNNALPEPAAVEFLAHEVGHFASGKLIKDHLPSAPSAFNAASKFIEELWVRGVAACCRYHHQQLHGSRDLGVQLAPTAADYARQQLVDFLQHGSWMSYVGEIVYALPNSHKDYLSGALPRKMIQSPSLTMARLEAIFTLPDGTMIADRAFARELKRLIVSAFGVERVRFPEPNRDKNLPSSWQKALTPSHP